LSGTVLDTKTLQGIANKIVLLSCPDTIANLQYATTNSEGQFFFAIGDYYNEKELFLTLKEINEQYKLVVDDDFIKTSSSVVSDSSTTLEQKEYLTKCQNIFQINKSYRMANDTINLANKTKTGLYPPKVYYNKAITIYPKDFVSLNNFSEISVELLPQVRILKVDSKYKLQILGASAYKVQNTDPAIFLDGVFVDDINKIMNLSSDKIKKIELQNVERVIGDISFPGVMAISTYTNEILSTAPASYSCRFKNSNFEVNKHFFKVNTNLINDSKVPFVKQLLYWNPDIKTLKDQNYVFDFYTSDNTGTFIINIEGISENGTPISDLYRIKVDNHINRSVK
jgi:signal peptidase I